MPGSERGRPAPGHVVRRWLYLTHRWIGIASCLLFAMWFASGLVMIYMPYPALTRAERMAGLQTIDWNLVRGEPPAASGTRSIALEMRDGRPIWRVRPWDGPERIVPAGGEPEALPVDAAWARRVAGQFGRARVDGIERIVRDQWTVAGTFDRHRPLWKASLGDAAGTELYVSSTTGDVVLDTRRTERFWNWLGAVPHWIYPAVLRQDSALWRQVVLWVAGPCIAAALTGMWIGILRTRLRRRRFGSGRMTPYRGWMLWHHVAGLVGGIFLLGWIFSGWLSVDPGRVFFGGNAEIALRGYAGDLALPPAAFGGLKRAVRVEAVPAPGERTLLIVTQADAGREVLDARTHLLPVLPQSMLAEAAVRLVPGAKIVGLERLSAPDAYWYEAGSLPQLPVIRVRFGDPAETWVHLDPQTGAVLGSIDRRGRAYRWAFDLLHKWDLNALTLRRPLWDIVLWTLSLLGLITSVSAIRIGWKRLRRPRRRT